MDGGGLVLRDVGISRGCCQGLGIVENLAVYTGLIVVMLGLIGC